MCGRRVILVLLVLALGCSQTVSKPKLVKKSLSEGKLTSENYLKIQIGDPEDEVLVRLGSDYKCISPKGSDVQTLVWENEEEYISIGIMFYKGAVMEKHQTGL